MSGSITYEMLSAVISALVVVGGAWFFIERRITGVETLARVTIDTLERELKLDVKATAADLSLLREKLHREFVSHDSLIRFEERILAELREIRRVLNKDKRADDHDQH
jgi:hypothetical protein